MYFLVNLGTASSVCVYPLSPRQTEETEARLTTSNQNPLFRMLAYPLLLSALVAAFSCVVWVEIFCPMLSRGQD